MAKKFSVMEVLNGQSNSERATSKAKAEIELISVHKLVASENNFYDTTDILDLKDSIEMLGLKQNLVVVKAAEDQYRVVAGHRRMMAVRALVEEGKGEFELVPCRVESDVDAIKEEMLLIYTNSTTRQLSDYEKLEQFKRLKILVAEYKKTNAVPGRVRDLLAEALNVSPANVNRLEQVDKKLSTEFKQELKEQKIAMDTAVELAKLDKGTQNKALKEHKEKPLKKKDVEKFKASNELRERAQEAFSMPKKDKYLNEGHEDYTSADDSMPEVDEAVFIETVQDENYIYLEALDEVINFTCNLIAEEKDICKKDAYERIKSLLEVEKANL